MSAAMPMQHAVEDELQALIAEEGPIPISRFMAMANAAYYSDHDPFGVKGDFITAPEVSQMFGELIGLVLADAWKRTGGEAAYVELGPGRGTLASDALRSMAVAGLDPQVHFVETSTFLRQSQAEVMPAAIWHDTTATLPTDVPLMIVANEFFDAMPVEQYVKTMMGWRELMIRHDDIDGFATVPGQLPAETKIPQDLLDAHTASVYERSSASRGLMRSLARRLAKQGGVMIVIDYGYYDRAAGDTLQAVHAHAYANPYIRPGNSDLTAHVDFSALKRVAQSIRGLKIRGPIEQGDWLVAIGIDLRADQLTRANPERAAELAAARMRLIHPEQMGTLFKVMGISGPGWPAVPGL
jgi:NADH dehydrogenase [ubiquinone] 1 alpha subcomplex assembly factor 7